MSWARLDAELDAWRRSGRQPSLWWRDDDVSEPTPALARLLDLAAQGVRALGEAQRAARDGAVSGA